MVLFSSWGFCQVLVLQSFAFSFRLSNVRSLIECLVRSFFVLCEKPMLRMLNSLSFLCDVEMFLQCESVAQLIFSLRPMVGDGSLYESLAYHRESLLCGVTAFCATRFFQHLFSLVVHW